MMGTELLPTILVVLSTFLYTASQSPCLNVKDVPPKRFVNFNNENYPLVLGVSDRLTHRLTTEVLKIYTSEVLGYPNVVVKKMHPASNIQEVLQQFMGEDESASSLPSIMVDIEAWVPLGVSVSNYEEEIHVSEYGSLGPHVRFGWFIPTDMITRVTNLCDQLVTYASFLTPERAEVFSLLDEDILKIPTSEKFEPDWCKTQKCATLIASSHHLAAEYIQDEINRMHLYAKVYWVGDHFTQLMEDLLRRYSTPTDPRRSARIPVIFGHTFELLPIQRSLTNVFFPVCEPYKQKFGNSSCNYEGQRIVKLGWKELLRSAPAFHDVLQKVDFDATDYQELVSLYHGNISGGYDVAACKWLRNHQDRIVGEWRPYQQEERLKLVGIFPLERTVFNPRGTFIGAHMAIEEIKKSKFLGKYILDFDFEDGDCRSEVVMRTFIDVIIRGFRRIVGILGPACSETVEPLAGVSKFFETVVISYSAEGSSFDRSKYPYFFRTIGENRQYQYVYQELFRRVGWKQVASLSEEGAKYAEYVSQTQDLLTKDGVTFIANRKFSQSWLKEPNKMREYLKEFKSKEARIIIADVNEGAAKALMCEAYHMNMTAKNGFVWFLPSWLMPFWMEAALLYDETSQGRHLYCSTQQMLEAIDAHLSLSHAFFAPDNETILTNKTVKQWKEEYRAEMKKYNSNEYSDYAGYAYDAVWVYAKALNSLIRENETYISNLRSTNVTARFVSFIQNTNFSGVSGRIEFNSGSSRNATRVNIFQWSSKDKNRIEVGHYDPKSEIKFFFNTTAIRWLTGNGQAPWDGTKEDDCIVDWVRKALNSDCQTAMIVANIVGFGLLLLLGLVGFLFIKHRYDKKVQLTEKYIKSLGLDLLSVSAMNGLDMWEIPKDRVVINRKLGEGAFGMVYGGEAFFEEKGWVAVAVKTLKVGSSTEQKLDFLSEAEVMKRFDHKNIVQLLGVCTKNEPVYTIMEFMLYGDLKTFFLARRHLVNDQNMLDDNDEISSVRLTNMALDIARALSYLAELKYVHRDVASRNCLVNASRVVKLGDFGMTRPMCDSDYYRFTRKGWLPVRWMAPESLVMGVFTPASDVWSFGVLLYEIITFGNFPFQGMSNIEVLDYVKEGHTLTIPSGVKANLEGLIKSCWNVDPQKRPPAAEIVEFLANNPRLLSPTLDGPLLSVAPLEESPFTLPFPAEGTKTRKFSLRQRTSTSPSNDLRPWAEVSEPLLPSLSRTYRSDGFHTIPEDQVTIQDSTFPL